MTTVGQAATAEIVSGAATAPGWLARAIGLGAVALALLSAFATIEVARARSLFDQNRDQFRQFLTAQSNIRGLPAVMMIDGDLNVIEQAGTNVSQTFVKPSREVLAASNETEPQIALFLDANYVAA